MTDDKTQVFLDHKQAIFGLAYRMMGARADADDIVQDVALKWARQEDWQQINNPKGWLLTVTGRIAIDQLRRAYRARETYVGPWLPEPLVTDAIDLALPERADDRLDRAETLSMAIMTLMDALGPEERVAVLLHDVFDLQFNEVGAALGKSESAARKLASRARKTLRDAKPVNAPLDDKAKGLLTAFLEASQTGNRDQLLSLMAPDITLVSDGGGKVRAALRPLNGINEVLTVWASVTEKQQDYVDIEPAIMNNQPAFLIKDKKGRVTSVVLLTLTDTAVSNIYIVRNPDKLVGLGD